MYYGFNAVYLRMFGTAKRDSMLEKLKQPGIEYFGASHACAPRLAHAIPSRTASHGGTASHRWHGYRTGRGSGSHSD